MRLKLSHVRAATIVLACATYAGFLIVGRYKGYPTEVAVWAGMLAMVPFFGIGALIDRAIEKDGE